MTSESVGLLLSRLVFIHSPHDFECSADCNTHELICPECDQDWPCTTAEIINQIDRILGV